MSNDTKQSSPPPQSPLLQAADPIERIINALDYMIHATIQITSLRVVEPGQPPRLELMLTQLVANQVVEMNALRETLIVLNDLRETLIIAASFADTSPTEH